MKIKASLFAVLFHFLVVLSAQAELNLDISGSHVEVKDATTLRIRDLSLPGYEGKYWADLQWDPDALVFVPVNAGVETTPGKSWTLQIDTNSAGLLGSLYMTLNAQVATRTIDISLTGVQGGPTFTFSSLVFIQNGKDFDFGYAGASARAAIIANGGWNPYAAVIPVGVTRTGTISEVPEWFDFNTPFTITYFPNSYSLQ